MVTTNEGAMFLLRLESTRREFFETLDFNIWLESKQMNLQREWIWSDDQKEEFIRSIIIGRHIPPVVVFINTKCPKWGSTILVMDGKHRLTTFMDFLDNKFPLTINGVEYFYDDLHESIKFPIRNWNIHSIVYYMRNHRTVSDDTLIDLYDMINFTGTPQDIEHLNRLKGINC